MVKLPDQVVLGTWKRIDKSLACEPMVDARFMAPVVVAVGYQLKCRFTKRTGNDAVMVILPVGRHSVDSPLTDGEEPSLAWD